MKGATDSIDEGVDLGNINENDISTNEQGQPLTWFCGEQLIAGVFICDRINEFTKPSESGAGKK